MGGCQKGVKPPLGKTRSGVALLLAGLVCFMVTGLAPADRVFHIVETPGALDLRAEETPTDKYYERLRTHLAEKYPGAPGHFLDHLEALEAW